MAAAAALAEVPVQVLSFSRAREFLLGWLPNPAQLANPANPHRESPAAQTQNTAPLRTPRHQALCNKLPQTRWPLFKRTHQSGFGMSQFLAALNLYVWRVGAGKFAATVSIVAHDPKPVETYRDLFHEHEELVHVTV